MGYFRIKGVFFMQVIPIEAIPNQSFNIVLNEQNCIIHLYQRGDYLFMDLTVNATPIRQGAICLIDTDVINYPFVGFSGYLFFSDLSGKYGTPNYKELGNRFILIFVTEDEINV